MKGFKFDDNGDVVIENNKIQMIEDKELLRQTIQSVLSTNKGEWFFNLDEGIDFNNVLGKQNEEMIKNEILQGLKQVDNTFIITQFNMDFDKRTRKAHVIFTAVNSSGEEVSEVKEYA